MKKGRLLSVADDDLLASKCDTCAFDSFFIHHLMMEEEEWRMGSLVNRPWCAGRISSSVSDD
jgi:hypothetical protein